MPKCSFLNLRNIFVFCALCVLLGACTQEVRKRAYGFIKLGPISNFTKGDVHVVEHSLLVRRDAKGFYGMSTMCTHDLSPLVKKTEGSQTFWQSELNDSKYDYEGNVLVGPAKARLPFYELRFGAKKYGGVRDTLFAYIGNEKSKDWRLEIK